MFYINTHNLNSMPTKFVFDDFGELWDFFSYKAPLKEKHWLYQWNGHTSRFLYIISYILPLNYDKYQSARNCTTTKNSIKSVRTFGLSWPRLCCLQSILSALLEHLQLDANKQILFGIFKTFASVQWHFP